MVGSLDERTRDHLITMLLTITSRDTDRLVDTFLELGMSRQQVNRPLLKHDMELLLSRYYDQPLGEIKIGQVLEEMLTIVRHHHLSLPSNLALLAKTMAMNEGLGTQLDPSFRLTSVVVPYAQQLVLRQYSPLFWTKRLGRVGLDAAWLGLELPQQLRHILAGLERGDLKIGAEPVGVEPLFQRLEQWVNRIVLGVIVAAFINDLEYFSRQTPLIALSIALIPLEALSDPVDSPVHYLG